MFSRAPTRTSNTHYSYLLRVPQKVSDYTNLPRIRLTLDHYKFHGVLRELNELQNCIVNIGIFTDKAEIQDGKQPQSMWPFIPDHLHKILRGDYDAEWVLYGFEVRAYALTLYYYDLSQTDRRGMIELGCNFDTLQFQLRVPPDQDAIVEPAAVVGTLHLEAPTAQRVTGTNVNYVIFLWRNLTETQSVFRFLRRHYVECTATIVRSIKTASSSTSRRIELSGEDTLYGVDW